MKGNHENIINPSSGLYTDRYELAMAQALFKDGVHEQHATFDYFFRKIPFGGGYVIFCGLDDLLDVIENLHFSKEELEWLQADGMDATFLGYLKDFKFKGSIYSMNEGEVIFATEPILRAEGSLIEVQLIETLLLNYLNFQSLIATKAARMRHAAGSRELSEFGLRRAQGPGGLFATKASIAGGFNNTSNVLAAKNYNLKAVGTMAHSFIQSYPDEITAFRKFAHSEPHNCTLLVDTYDTLNRGIPNAIIVAKEMEQEGHSLKAIRLDSGDLAFLSKKARKMLDQSGLEHVKIIVSNQLDEYLIKSLIDQQAPIDVFGVGTSLATGQPDAALDGVYKLSQINNQPKIKLSENIQKVTLPGIKQVYRYKDENGFFVADAIALDNEKIPERMTHPFDPSKTINLNPSNAEPLISKVMDQGKKIIPDKSAVEVSKVVASRLLFLPDEHKRFNFPHLYKIGISDSLMQLRNDLRKQYKK